MGNQGFYLFSLQSPRSSEGISIWQLLPDEILLHIFSCLTQYELVQCAQTCSLFNRIALDESLCKYLGVVTWVQISLMVLKTSVTRLVLDHMTPCRSDTMVSHAYNMDFTLDSLAPHPVMPCNLLPGPGLNQKKKRFIIHYILLMGLDQTRLKHFIINLNYSVSSSTNLWIRPAMKH